MFVYLGKYILSAREVEWKQGKCGCDCDMSSCF